MSELIWLIYTFCYTPCNIRFLLWRKTYSVHRSFECFFIFKVFVFANRVPLAAIRYLLNRVWAALAYCPEIVYAQVLPPAPKFVLDSVTMLCYYDGVTMLRKEDAIHRG